MIYRDTICDRFFFYLTKTGFWFWWADTGEWECWYNQKAAKDEFMIPSSKLEFLLITGVQFEEPTKLYNT